MPGGEGAEGGVGVRALHHVSGISERDTLVAGSSGEGIAYELDFAGGTGGELAEFLASIEDETEEGTAASRAAYDEKLLRAILKASGDGIVLGAGWVDDGELIVNEDGDGRLSGVETYGEGGAFEDAGDLHARPIESGGFGVGERETSDVLEVGVVGGDRGLGENRGGEETKGKQSYGQSSDHGFFLS